MSSDDPARPIPQTLSGELAGWLFAPAQVPGAARLLRALSNLFTTSAEMSDWLQVGNPGFGGRSPKELIEAGEGDVLWEMVHQTRQQAFA